MPRWIAEAGSALIAEHGHAVITSHDYGWFYNGLGSAALSRATGVPYDVRRAHPYSVYPELEFDIPTRTDGD